MKKEDFAKLYIERNCMIAAKNCIWCFMYENKSFCDFLKEREDYERTLHICRPEDFTGAVKSILYTMNTEEGVKKFIKKLMLRFSYGTMKTCVAKEFENPNLTPREITKLIATEVYSIEKRC